MHPTENYRVLRDLPLPSEYSVGQVLKAAMTHVNSTRNFALQPSNNEATLEKITDLCADLGDDRPNPNTMAIGTLWCALFREDGQWYRSLIQSIDTVKKLARVYHIDYGNFDTISMESDLRWISDELMSYPPQLIECQWIQAGTTLRFIVKLEELIDRDEPLTITVVKTKYSAAEMNLHIGSGQAGMIVVSIEELIDEEETYVKPTVETVLEIESDIDIDEMESASDDSLGGSSTSVDMDVPKDLESSSSMVQHSNPGADCGLIPTSVTVEQSLVIQPNLEMKTDAQSLDYAGSLPKLPEPLPDEVIPTVRPAPFVEKQVLAPSQTHTDFPPKVTVGNQFGAPELLPVQEQASTMSLPIQSGEKAEMERYSPERLSQIPGNGSFIPFHEAIMETGTRSPNLGMDTEDPFRLKVTSLEARMTLLDIELRRTNAETKKYTKFLDALSNTVTALETASLDSRYQHEVDKEKLGADLKTICTEISQLMELLEGRGNVSHKDGVGVAVTQHKFSDAQDELQYLRIEIEAETMKISCLKSCLNEKGRLLADRAEEYEKLMQIVEFKEEEIRTLSSRLPPNSAG